MDVHREDRFPSRSPLPDPEGAWNPNPDEAVGSAAFPQAIGGGGGGSSQAPSVSASGPTRVRQRGKERKREEWN